ncbi:MAG: DUF350 domain-containing protein [Calditrichaeota bacterium]|nr:MAG: DUF350 domain-containing protein [Calditrichota bacterium]MBL1206895.1 DUF350 domain-containing protein [Calditrichota bacterium]NOG46721.1 DUF350 domain-containing protein [Calditrichota bacterium]
MSTYIEELLSIEPVFWLLKFEGAAYLITVFIVLYAAKLVYDLFTPFSLNEQLTNEDNKAIAVSFSGYVLGVMIILLSIFHSGTAIEGGINSQVDLLKDLLATIIWGIIGILLLNISRVINDKLLLSKFDNMKELVKDKNVGTGAALFGSYVGSGLIIRAAIYGESTGWTEDILTTLIYFIMGQIGFIIFGWVYQLISRYDVHEEIEKDNISAGVAFGLSLVAISILLSGYIISYSSLPGFAVWFVMGLFVLMVSRYIVDKMMLPGSLLDEEISKDHNWGAALVEGTVAVGIALLMVPAFLG